MRKYCSKTASAAMVREAYGDRVILFNIDSERMEPGTLAVVEQRDAECAGRQRSDRPRRVADGQTARWQRRRPDHRDSGIFNPAPGIMARSMLNEQLASGVSAVDSFFPIVLGQRIAILGDSKSGKSTFLSQLSANQEGTDRIVIYVLIGKRKVDIERLLSNLATVRCHGAHHRRAWLIFSTR